ncbi:hypothetical protein BDQ12DRAFT_722760 [Crucibulum laeve]|uniref:Uncharacterized protein n=1 Tax=Crucibulum laeve TaxID=68775 RepID=A0A5C3M2E6_9AGAR|nr:hypothetical protein BDQ12DRAFT_722760 [Crucibulum laeve]
MTVKGAVRLEMGLGSRAAHLWPISTYRIYYIFNSPCGYPHRAHVVLTDTRAGESLTSAFNASLKLDITLAGSLVHAKKVKVILRVRDRWEVRSELVKLSGSAIQVDGEEGLGEEKQAELRMSYIGC